MPRIIFLCTTLGASTGLQVNPEPTISDVIRGQQQLVEALTSNVDGVLKNATSQGWAIGMVALGCIVMFCVLALLVRWFMAREGKTASEALARELTMRQESAQREQVLREEGLSREQRLRTAIEKVDDFGRNTVVRLVTETTAALERVATAMHSCLAKQTQLGNYYERAHTDADQAHDDMTVKHVDADRQHDDAGLDHHAGQ